MTGMFDLMISLLNPINVEYYCGDAAGRKGDFSRSDLYFANNCNMLTTAGFLQIQNRH